jgi:asparagine synthetase A
MTTNNQSKNDGLINFLTSVLKKGDETQDKKDAEFAMLAASVSILAEELKQIASSVELLISAVANQNKAISDLYTVQEFLLKQMKLDLSAPEETKLPDINKVKREKPN